MMGTEALFSILALVGMGYALFRGMKWLARAGQTHARRDHQLTPADLRVLEESAARLMADLRATADSCVARIGEACDDAERRLRVPDAAGGTPAPSVAVDVPATTAHSTLGSTDIVPTAAQIARETGSMTGEVELLQRLRALSGG